MKLVKGDFSVNKKSQHIKSTLQNENLSEQGASYSSMLLELADPYIKMSPNDLEAILNLGMVGWNMAVSNAAKFPGFNVVYDATVNSSMINKKEKEIINKLMKSKQQKFPEYTNFIENYELGEDNTGAIKVTVTSKPYDQFMNDGLMEDDLFDEFDEFDEFYELQYQEGYVNRTALLVKPKTAFWDWFKKNDPEFRAPEVSIGYGVYLIPEKNTEKKTMKWLKKNFDTIFIHEMESRFGFQNYWPEKRNYRLFLDFFEFESQSIILDVEKEPVTKG